VLARQRAPRTIKAGKCEIDLGAMKVARPGTDSVFLQARDCQVLKVLIDSAPRVVPRSEILDRVWGESRFPTPRAVDNAIVRLRDALMDDQGVVIRSIRGVGYQWAADAR
jgi:DNA-binding response OmpR family regulator